jgi:hypothetical protein
MAVVMTACDVPQPPQPGTPSTASADAVPFVVFLEPSVVIEGVGGSIPVPATVGSTVSTATIASSDPSVVEVTADGRLRARSLGRATLRAISNQTRALEVEVREKEEPRASLPAPPPAVEAGSPVQGRLALRPSSADIRLGQVLLFEATVGAQRASPEWHFDGPVLLQQTAPNVFVATRVGKTKVCASGASQTVCARVAVDR